MISQSGETSDTLAALREAQSLGQKTLAITNHDTSSMAREATVSLPLGAGKELAIPATKSFTFHAHGQGRVGDFEMAMRSDGYSWDIPAGPMTIRYTATIKDGTWREVGDRIASGKEPVRFFEMNLKRVGDSAWPGAGAIPMK